jgi:tetratricopeptide (TPR) repeat protein
MRRWLLLLLIATPALAQTSALTGTPALAQTPAERAAALDHLLDALKAAPSAEAAAPLEQQIMQRLLQAGSPVVTLLMSRGAREMQAESAQQAIEDFTDAITLDPNLAEAYHQRAVARFAAGDTQGAIADIEQTLQHQPRDFAALRTLAMIAESRKDWKGAYAAWQKLLEIDPKTPGGEDKLKDLHRRAFGEET